MLSYSLLAALYPGYLGIVGRWIGVLLWPAVLAHVVIALLLSWQWIKR